LVAGVAEVTGPGFPSSGHVAFAHSEAENGGMCLLKLRGAQVVRAPHFQKHMTPNLVVAEFAAMLEILGQ
jgi:hypothetical protein